MATGPADPPAGAPPTAVAPASGESPGHPGRDDHLARLADGTDAWNRWRADTPRVLPDLRGAGLARWNLAGLDLRDADLRDAVLADADLDGADLRGAQIGGTVFNGARFGHADLRGVAGWRAPRFIGCDLRRCRLGGGGLFEALLWDADLRGCDLQHLNLRGAAFDRARLDGADLRDSTLDETRWLGVQAEGVRLEGVSMTMATVVDARLAGARAAGVDRTGSRLLRCDLRGADLRGATLHVASLVDVDLADADLSGSAVFGVAAWQLLTAGARQRDLVVTRPGEAVVSCDDLETAQFVHLLLHNEKLRQVIDTVGRKAVLLLGRFSAERKAVLDALRDALRSRGLLPMLFDFGPPSGRDLTETVSTLAHLARFVIADLTDARSLPQELKTIVPALPSVPVQPLLLQGEDAWAMFADLGGYASVLPPTRYRDLPHLLEILDAEVIAPAERRVDEIRERRAAFEARLASG